ncbi:MAG: hypothetical protein OEZ43_09610 [Gammaproteobacteria bacterium]|nr:hypothetical protein [Gammaproteobacteria bacterium]
MHKGLAHFIPLDRGAAYDFSFGQIYSATGLAGAPPLQYRTLKYTRPISDVTKSLPKSLFIHMFAPLNLYSLKSKQRKRTRVAELKNPHHFAQLFMLRLRPLSEKAILYQT